MPPTVAISLLSAATLALEVLLVRMFSISHWHHFAYMIISLALLGYGASGTFLTFARDRLLPHVRMAMALAATAFAFSALVNVAVAQRLPLNLLELAWDGRQPAWLTIAYILLAVPFFCSASAIGLALAAAGEEVGSLYRSDLIGAGAGALGILGLLTVLPVDDCLRAIAGVGLLAAVASAWHASVPRGLPAALVMLAVAVPAAWPGQWARPQPSPYKELSLALTTPGAEVVAERSGPLGLLTVVRSPLVPFRYAPGLSLAATQEPPEQLAVFTDATGMTAINRFDGNLETAAYLDRQTAALPFHLIERPRVLILGAGGGTDVLLALYHNARQIDAVEIDPNMVALVGVDFAAFAGHLFAQPTVRVHVGEARSFVESSNEQFDLIHIALLDSFTAAAAGLHALNESTLYTVEAFTAYLDRLTPETGYLAVTRWLKVPPRDSLKLLATAVAALERRGIADPARHIALVNGWRTATLLVKAGPLSELDNERLRRFCRTNGFDPAYFPGISADEVNRFAVFDRPHLYEGALRLLGNGRDRFFADYRFDVRPATDDRPYFFHFLKWQTLVDLLRLRDAGGIHLIEWGYPVLVATLAQATVVSLVLILLPLLIFDRRSRGQPPERPRRPRIWVGIYFFCLGLAFLFIEIAFIQRFQLFLGHPLYAVAVALTGFLIFAGVGSGCSRWWVRGLRHPRRAVAAAVAIIAVLCALYLAALPEVFRELASASQPLKILFALILLGPLAFFMGMPFPIGLAATAAAAPRLVPWAWGINGCASVLSAMLATVLAIHAGFSVVIIAAVALYALAAAALASGARGVGATTGPIS